MYVCVCVRACMCAWVWGGKGYVDAHACTGGEGVYGCARMLVHIDSIESNANSTLAIVQN